MTEAAFHPSIIIFVIGSLVVLAILLKTGLKRIGLPALVGYLVLGFLLRLAWLNIIKLPEMKSIWN